MYLGIDDRYICVDCVYIMVAIVLESLHLRLRNEIVQSHAAKKILEPYWASPSLRQRALNSLCADMQSTNATIVALLANNRTVRKYITIHQGKLGLSKRGNCDRLTFYHFSKPRTICAALHTGSEVLLNVNDSCFGLVYIHCSSRLRAHVSSATIELSEAKRTRVQQAV
jgi:hypothetical protein